MQFMALVFRPKDLYANRNVAVDLVAFSEEQFCSYRDLQQDSTCSLGFVSSLSFPLEWFPFQFST